MRRQLGRSAKDAGPNQAVRHPSLQNDGGVRVKEEGRSWVRAKGSLKDGGEWLIGRCIRVFYDREARWFSGIVMAFDPTSTSANGIFCGGVHDVQYDDGCFWEDLTKGKWEYDANEGDAGEYWEDFKERSLRQNKGAASRENPCDVGRSQNKKTISSTGKPPPRGAPSSSPHRGAVTSKIGPLVTEKSRATSSPALSASSHGRILLGKVKGYPWWPAKVRTRMSVPLICL
jgi:hypothetical protein